MTEKALESKGTSRKRHKKMKYMQKSQSLSTFPYGNGIPDLSSLFVTRQVVSMQHIPYLQAFSKLGSFLQKLLLWYIHHSGIQLVFLITLCI